MKLSGLYQAEVKRIGPKNERTGIYKYSINQGEINQFGLTQDVQIDKRFHGGPERALHQYALLSYEKIIKAYPLLHKKAQPGSMGENLSAAGMHENNVHIGDIYQIGACQIQVSGPRMPCFKISEKFSTPKLDKFVATHAIHGWYYRVLKGGTLFVNDSIKLIERVNPELSIAQFLQVVQKKVTDTDKVSLAMNANGLDPEWKDKLKR
ncbi:MOSC domain-containing protein [Paraglaciecola sp.]|uniref:MOSC domain-containing protein n=1 Tax=Paraglaciecola sp. TaxID=1920173 RepID=UPI003EF344A9